jgi:hypothetical protein
LHAMPEPGFRFVNWRGKIWDYSLVTPKGPRILNLSSTNDWLDFTLGIGAANVLAVFEPAWRLQTKVPFGGWITSNPPRDYIDPGTEVALTAIAKPGFEFSEWAGDVSGTNAIIRMKMTNDFTAIANFRAAVTPQLVLQSKEFGDGVSSNVFGFTLLGEVGGNYRIEASGDLTNWIVFRHIRTTNGSVRFNDILDSKRISKYYRACLD